MEQIAGFILAGGESRRMGADKSQLLLGGQTFVEVIGKALSAICSSVTIVGGHTFSTFPRVPDIFPKWGALGGVHTSLTSCPEPWCLIVACDFPLVTTKLFEWMASMREGFDAVAPIQRDGIPQPLCALYRREACLPIAEQLINSGERKPIALLQSVRTRWLTFAEIESLPGAESFFENINTPEDYDRIVQKGRVNRMT